ncbi:MAG TPA: C-terminal helicase domain-containing protein, partial [Niastella sp.]|nr:C-terminal helicase domain-containing protein [Niastella sp.]
RAKFKIAEIHSDLEQAQREDVLNGFTSGRIPVLVATDILSRGIDIDTIDLVINYDVPRDAEDYVHRIGRTARAEADGMAFTLVSPIEQNKFAVIEKLIGKEVEKGAVPEEFGPTPEYKPQQRSRNRGGGGGRGQFHRRPNNNGRQRGNKA